MPQHTEHTTSKFWLPLVFSFVLILGILLGIKLQKEVPVLPTNTTENSMVTTPGKLEELLRYIEARYVDEVDRDELIQKAIDKLLGELDPHSTYIPSEQVKRVNEQLDGNFEGIGIEFLQIEDTIVVIKPTEGGPSDKAGILPGDKIVYVDDSLFVGQKLNETNIIDSLRGVKGSTVKLGILRPGQADILYFDVIRDEIPIQSIDAAYMLNQNTGYIKINRFSATTHTEFLDFLSDMVDKDGLENVVIDVRDNPGGYLQEATSILNQFFQDRDKLLVYTEGRSVHRSDYETTGKSFFSIDNIAVLVDEGSASASEILAGAIQDYDRGIIIGRRSFGKGLVQEQYSLSDGSAIRLTVARYYTPSGRSIQRNYDDKDGYEDDLDARLESGELFSGKQLSLSDTTQYFTQEGRTVYGGGGIIPDVFVPLDSAKSNPYFAYLQPHIRTFIYQYYQANKPPSDGTASVLSYDSMEDFVENFDIPDQVYQDFQQSIANEDINTGDNEVPHLEELTKLYLKARLAKHLYDDNGLYAVLNDQDDVVKKALQILEMPNPLTVLEDSSDNK
ncbi:MAG: S41 family peptidase [Bacteroidota bacterium]